MVIAVWSILRVPSRKGITPAVNEHTPAMSIKLGNSFAKRVPVFRWALVHGVTFTIRLYLYQFAYIQIIILRVRVKKK